MKRLSLIFCSLLLVSGLIFFAGSALAQKNRSEITLLKDKITRLQAELSECQNAKIKAGDSQRNEAIASLKAIHSALKAGANMQEFKKYQIESRIKIDALPDTPNNKIAKDISDIYRDATTFGITRITGVISPSDLESARIKYKDNENIAKYLSDMTSDYNPSKHVRSINKIDAEAISQMLFLMADRKFPDLK